MELKNENTVDLFKKLKEIFDEIDTRKQESRDKLQYFDRELSKVEHELEINPIDIQRGYKFAKRIQDIRMKRRVIKRDIELFNEIERKYDENWSMMQDLFRTSSKIRGISKKVVSKNNKWSNYNNLGEVNYQELTEEFNESFGDIDEQLKKLKKIGLNC